MRISPLSPSPASSGVPHETWATMRAPQVVYFLLFSVHDTSCGVISNLVERTFAPPDPTRAMPFSRYALTASST